MKEAIPITVGMLLGISSMAQGVLDFSNLADLGARISDPSGTVFLAGSAFYVDLYYGPVGYDSTTFSSLGLAIPFNTGEQAGFFSGGVQAIPGFYGGQQVAVQPRAWRVSDGATWAEALIRSGMMSPFTAPVVNVTLVSASANPPPPPPKLVGYVGHALMVPEPATMLMGLAGFISLFFFRHNTA